MEPRERDLPLRLVVLAGGDSAERAISLRSGQAVAEALESAGHQVTLVDPAVLSVGRVDWSRHDACFIALHGGAGEDGRIQHELAQLGVPFTGSDAEACRLAMSKSASKDRFFARGVPTLEYELVGPADAPHDVALYAARLGFPLIVKPDCQGSSIGITAVRAPDGLAAAILHARQYDEVCLIEPLVAGREFTVALLDDRPLPTIEIVAPDSIFSYAAKYESALTEYRFDFALPATARAQIAAAAVGAGRALGTRGLARVDLVRSHWGHVSVLEVNTVPGLTERSLAPQAAARAGVSISQLCEWMVRQCLTPVGAS